MPAIPAVWKIAAALALVLAVLAFGGWSYWKGQKAEDNAIAGKTLEQSEKGRKARETNDEKARSLDDQRALDCLRRPTGC